MSSFPKSARHPDVTQQIENWRSLKCAINFREDLYPSDFPNLAINSRQIHKTHDVVYFQGAREVVGANSIKALAKSYEALHALSKCGNKGINMSAMIQGYNASYFAARGFCMLMGFSPINRDSTITLDAFYEEVAGTRKYRRMEKLLRLYKYSRWGHQGLWKLTERLINTVKVPEELKETKIWLRKAKLVESSKLRNSFQYDDSRLAPIENSKYVDFPDIAEEIFFHKFAPEVLKHQFLVTKYLMEICMMVIEQAEIGQLLSKYVSNRRFEFVFNNVW